MSRRTAWKAAGMAAGAAALALLGAILVLRSSWFSEKVRQRIVETVETATGGRVEIGAFRFDWSELRAEVSPFTIHGTEPADRPALFHANSVTVGLKIVSILKRAVDIQYLDVASPRVYLMVYPGGRTNVPEPKVKSQVGKTPVETVFDLAIGRYSIANGLFEVEGRGQTPFDAHGRNLNAKLLFERPAADYRGTLSLHPLAVQLPGASLVEADIDLALLLSRDRIGITAAQVGTGDSRVEFSGAIEGLASPRAAFQFNASLSVADAARILHISSPNRGTVAVDGQAGWTESSGYSLTGRMRASVVEYRDSVVRLQDIHAESPLAAGPQGIDLEGLRFSLNYVYGSHRVPVGGRIATVALRNRNLDVGGLAFAALDGSFNGSAHLRNWEHYAVEGTLAGFDARRGVAVYSPVALPWDGRVSGTVELSGSFRQKREFRGTTNLTITPEPGSAPVHGQIAASYEARGGSLDLGQSTMFLPSSRVSFSGAIGRQMRVHLETHDPDDFLPTLGESAASLNLHLGGTAVFDGTVSGRLDDPQIAGRLGVTNFSYSGRPFDKFDAAVNVSPEEVRLASANLAYHAMRAQFQMALGLRDWKTEDASPLSGGGTVRNATIADFAGAGAFPITGAFGATGQVAGSLGNPQLNADFDVTKGTLGGEPFDRISGHVGANGSRVELSAGQAAAGTRQLRLSATFDRAGGRFDTGRLRFHLASNAIALDQVQTLGKARPGIKGTVQVTADGVVDLAASGGRETFRIEDLRADIDAVGLQLTGQALGNARVTATSQGQVLTAHLESNFANSAIHGDGRWRLEGDYPGSATVTFSKIDIAQLRAWISPSSSPTPSPFTGSTEGELRIEGPALKPEALKAELRLPQFEISPAARPGIPTAALALRNSGPIVATMANSVITVESARLTGKATDIAVTGKVLLGPKNSLDLRVNGHADMGLLQNFDRDIQSSGSLTADASLRGPLESPQVSGRMAFQNVALNIADFPNGISNANGTVLFNGDRATIQTFSGETGGGKIVLSGFASYGGGQAIFRLHASAEQVRVRYPEGVSNVANADFNLTGTSERSMVSGTVTVLRTGFNPRSDVSSMLATSAEPVRTPSAGGGILDGMTLDVQIATAPDIQVQSSLTQDIQVEANLRLRGTATNPVLLGRVNVTQGQLLFFGTKYNITQGSISFYNPTKIEPILDIDLETKARGIDVTLTVSGPLKKLNLTPRSDPPLQFNEIVSLLATGQTPSSDPTLLAQQSTAPQSWQQSGASALLGQAIASPVAGRLQRFFGVSKLRIDPTLPGVEYNPQARITLEQQITPEITFTYITNVTSSNPQVVSVEWDFSKQWSAVAVRDENGLLGLDFFYKRQFK